jgi:transcriptional regulator with XRE-family HTH domain
MSELVERRQALGELLRTYRERAPLTHEGLGGLTGKTARFVREVERGTREVPDEWWELVDQLCGAGGHLAHAHRELYVTTWGVPAELLGLSFPRAVDDAACVDNTRHLIGQLLAADRHIPGSVSLPFALPLVREAYSRLQVTAGEYLDELYATAAELLEIVAWLGVDARRDELASRLNIRAAKLAQASGDKSLALLIEQNQSMIAVEHLGRPDEGLRIAQNALANPGLPARVRCMFLIRAARARAAKHGGGAARLLAEAHSLYQDGVSDADPRWAWIDESELRWQAAAVASDCDDWGTAVDLLSRSIDTETMTASIRTMHLVALARVQAGAQAWNDFTDTVDAVCTCATPSRRAAAIVKQTRWLAELRPAPARALDAATQLDAVFAALVP